MSSVTPIMDEASVLRAMTRMAHQILEKDTENICLVGIRTRGVPMAHMLAENIRAISGAEVPVGQVDITMYRDDLTPLGPFPTLNSTDIPFSVEGKTVILVDDVIYTGRTARAAMEAVIKLGRPGRIRLLVMIDRGHRELPIRPDFVGKNIPTSRSEIVNVRFDEPDGETGVWLLK